MILGKDFDIDKAEVVSLVDEIDLKGVVEEGEWLMGRVRLFIKEKVSKKQLIGVAVSVG